MNRDMYEKFEMLLQSRNLTASEVAKATGLYPSTFSDWKSGRSNPGTEKLYLIAKFFEVPMEYFLNDLDLED